MRSRSIVTRLLAASAILAEPAGLHAQIANEGSPYSAYGFGDLLNTGQVASALMGGTGIAYSEPYSIRSANPASYAAAHYFNGEGLVRPVFEGGIRGVFVKQESSAGTTRRSNAGFMGLNVGIPFGKGRWGLGFGLNPYSEVGYRLTDSKAIDAGTVTYEYEGSGGLSRVFAGVGHVLWQQKPDSAGDLGGRLALGANFEFLFGGIEQTRNAIYPTGVAYTNTRAYSSLVLRAPTGSFGLHYSDALTSRVRITRARQQRAATAQARIERWKLEHVDAARLSPDGSAAWNNARTDEERIAWLRSIGWKVAYTDSSRMPRPQDFREVHPWRFTFGATLGLATEYSASSTDLVTTFVRGTTGVEITLDTVPSNGSVDGTLHVPLALGAGFSVYNARWLFTAEVRRRDWAGARVDVEGYALPSNLRTSMIYALGARYQPAEDGGMFQRTIYRAGARYVDDYLLVRGNALPTMALSAGLSIPLNAVQTNSQLHIGFEQGFRGTTGDGLLKESFTNLWVGVSITPWKRERWFQRYQIQ